MNAKNIKKNIYLDFETTGFSSDKDRVVDIGIIYEENGKIIDEFQVYIKLEEYPEYYYEGAMQIHQLTPEFLKTHGVTEIEAYNELVSFLDKYINKFDKDDKACLIAFNTNFDYRFLLALFERQGNKYLHSYIEKETYDVLKQAKQANSDRLIITENNKLVTVTEYLDIDLKDAHSALDDIRATRDVHIKLKSLEEDRLSQGFI